MISLTSLITENIELTALEYLRELLKDSPFAKIVFMTTGAKHQLVWFKKYSEKED